MKHVKVTYDETAYRVIRIAAAQAGLPIKQWVATTAARVASQETGLPLPPFASGDAPRAKGGTEAVAAAEAKGTQTENKETP